MKSKDDAMFWIPLWVDKWIFGSTRIELKHDERAIWVDLLALASKDSGYIRANPDTEYPVRLLAGMLNADTELLERSLQRCIETGKIRKAENGIGFYLINWKEYQLSQRHKRRFERMSAKAATMSAKAATRVEYSRVEYSKEDKKKKEKNCFDLFWETYPKKKSKGQAEKAWIKIQPDEQLLAKMIATIERAKKSDEWKKSGPLGIPGEFIPYPATWLNAKGWEDEFLNQPIVDEKDLPRAKCKFCKEIYFVKDGHECKPENIQLPR